MKRVARLLMFLLLLLNLCAQDFLTELPIDLQIKLILTTMQYKTNLLHEPNEPFRIGLFYTDSRMARQYANEFMTTFQTNYQSKTICKRPLQLETVNEIGKLQNKAYHLLIIAPDSEPLLKEILTITEKTAQSVPLVMQSISIPEFPSLSAWIPSRTNRSWVST